MKFSAVALIAVAAVASAQSIADIPACAQTCLLPALQATGCDLTDFNCSCSNTKFVTDSTACIQKSCSASDIEKAAKATYELCKSAGVIIPTQGPAAPTTTAAPTTAAVPTTAAPVTSETSEAPAPTTEAPPSYETSAAPSTYAPPATTIETTTYAVNTTAPTAAPPAYTGGAVAVAANVVLALGGAAAAFFL
jgi:uncharacterized membrane protein